jgi:hypothetical protein
MDVILRKLVRLNNENCGSVYIPGSKRLQGTRRVCHGSMKPMEPGIGGYRWAPPRTFRAQDSQQQSRKGFLIRALEPVGAVSQSTTDTTDYTYRSAGHALVLWGDPSAFHAVPRGPLCSLVAHLDLHSHLACVGAIRRVRPPLISSPRPSAF